MKQMWAFVLAVVAMAGCLPKQPLGKMCYVDSLPAEAQVFVLGKPAGLTPLEIELPPGVDVVVKKDGYADDKLTRQQLDAGYAMILLQMLYDVELNYIPLGSEVWENGRLLGKTPLLIKRTEGIYTFQVRHQYHEDLLDEFMVTGLTRRIKLLKPSVKYFPQTICLLNSNPAGATIERYSVSDRKITGKKEAVGITPFEISNQELGEKSSEHLFVYRLKGFSPQVITARGSIIAQIAMEPEISDTEPTSPWFSTLAFKTGELPSPGKSFTLWAENRDGKLTVLSKKGAIEVDILDMKTDFTDVSGAAWADDRFFVVRAKNPLGWVHYIIYDASMRRRFRINDAGFWHEAIIAGDIEWNQRIPVNPTQVDEFADIRLTVAKNFSVTAFRLYDGLNIEFTVVSDVNFDKSKLASVKENLSP